MTTNMHLDRDYSNMAESIRFAIRQSFKELYTCTPGIVESYDATTRRAVVMGALNIVKTDGTEVERAEVRDVPVVFPSGGGFSMTWPLEPGDPVLLVYSQRGLSEWKKTFDVSAPDVDGFFSEKDAIAIPGFGAPAEEIEHLIAVGSDGVRIKTTGTLAIEADDVTFRSPTDESARSIV